MRDSPAPMRIATDCKGKVEELPALRSIILRYVVALVAAELVLVFFNTVAGLFAHMLLIVMLLNHFLIVSKGGSPANNSQDVARRDARTLPALALVPFLRLLSLVLPFGTLPLWCWYPLIGVPLLLATVWVARALHYSWDDLGLKRAPLASQILITATGPLFGLLVYTLARSGIHTLINGQSPPLAIVVTTAALIFAGFVEELLFRGLLRHATGGIFWGTTLYGAMYIGSLSIGLMLIMTLVGLFFGWCAARTGAIWGVALANGALATSALVLYPLLFT